jgi:hypothetical protein|tara:strand:- start:485 stop:904 length:420 start_codon:yes stop_codon:yes gene_type:complete
MSAVSLGDSGVVGELIATTVATRHARDLFGAEQAGAGGIPTKGTFFIAPSANPTAYTLADGANEGDRVLIIHKGGANVGAITPAHLHGPAVSISMTGGQSVECVWSGATGVGTGQGWFVITRASCAVQASGVVVVAAIA